MVIAHISRKTKTKSAGFLNEGIYDSGRKCQMLLTMQLLVNLKSMVV